MWIALDFIVNCWCIILMFKSYNKPYNICCNKCEKCVGIKCLKYYSCNCCCDIVITQESRDRVMSVDSISNLEMGSDTSNVSK